MSCCPLSPVPSRLASRAQPWSTRSGRRGNLLEHIKVRHGDVEQGFAEADVIVEREYRTPTYEHMFMEPECSIGVPAGYDGEHEKLTVYVGSQIPYEDRDQIARGAEPAGRAGAGRRHAHRRRIRRQRGHRRPNPRRAAGPGDRPSGQDALRPAQSLLFHPKRHATVIRIKTGAKNDGTLTAVQAELYGDGGAYASLSEKVMTRATTHATGPYNVPKPRLTVTPCTPITRPPARSAALA